MKNLIATMGAAITLALLPVNGAPEDAPEPAEAKPVTAESIVGHWRPDEEAMLAKFEKEAADDPGAAALLPLIKAMLKTMVVEVTADEIVIYALGERQSSKYKAVPAKGEPRKLSLKIKEEGEDDATNGEATFSQTEKDKARIETMTLSDGDDDIVLLRIGDKEDFEKRKKTALEPPAGLE